MTRGEEEKRKPNRKVKREIYDGTETVPSF
jgi:hypothetical protein